jgi:hypothetical protein
MATILLADQTKLPYKTLSNVAQVNDAEVVYAANANAMTGLGAIKIAMLATFIDPVDCVQCGATGKIEAGATICPLCNGMTKTEGQCTVSTVTVGYITP